ncbi:hypothetical protein HaLaN_16681 [Haematococcus lacustris]|uniref:Uncharacterized protein n=1 Tax=Haematococcus lacustris TaxID=44745 RepID=A0A699ZUR9_HAELA|nr:hypothetical protein HaLaN_16681 [Haematococcus lacustris]
MEYPSCRAATARQDALAVTIPPCHPAVGAEGGTGSSEEDGERDDVATAAFAKNLSERKGANIATRSPARPPSAGGPGQVMGGQPGGVGAEEEAEGEDDGPAAAGQARPGYGDGRGRPVGLWLGLTQVGLQAASVGRGKTKRLLEHAVLSVLLHPVAWHLGRQWLLLLTRQGKGATVGAGRLHDPGVQERACGVLFRARPAAVGPGLQAGAALRSGQQADAALRSGQQAGAGGKGVGLDMGLQNKLARERKDE